MDPVFRGVGAHLFARPSCRLKVRELQCIPVFDETLEDSSRRRLAPKVLPLASVHAKEAGLNAHDEGVLRHFPFVAVDETKPCFQDTPRRTRVVGEAPRHFALHHIVDAPMTLREMTSSLMRTLLGTCKGDERLVQVDDAAEKRIAKITRPTRGFLKLAGRAGQLARQRPRSAEACEANRRGTRITDTPKGKKRCLLVSEGAGGVVSLEEELTEISAMNRADVHLARAVEVVLCK